MKWVIFYTLLASILLIIGVIKQEPVILIGAFLVSACAFYWIKKEKKIYELKNNFKKKHLKELQ